MSGADTSLDGGAQAPSFEQEVDASGLTCPLPILRA
jgi:tRNA 2-thiouridine synthesizing protein A